MKLEYDPEAQAAYLRFRDADGSPMQSIEGECVFDFDETGLVGIEIIDGALSELLDQELNLS